MTGEKQRAPRGRGTVDGRRVCPKCRENKCVSEYGFYQYVSKDGSLHERFCSYCKACELARDAANPRKTDARWSDWRSKKFVASSPGHKICRNCRLEKPLDQFNRSKVTADKLRTDCRECEAEYKREYAEAHPNWQKRCSIKSKYGITLEHYQTMFAVQDGRCNICGVKGERLCVDHDHKTNKVRSLLCVPCNVTLGQMEESVPRLKQMIAYLERHSV